jgi:hypothetical protein
VFFGYEKLLAWSLCGRFAVFSCGHGHTALYNALGMRIGRRFSLLDCIGTTETEVYRERSTSSSQTYEKLAGPFIHASAAQSNPFPNNAVSNHTGGVAKGGPQQGNSQSRLLAAFSPDATLLAVNSSVLPNHVFIFRTEDLLTSHFVPKVVLSQIQFVRQITWHDTSALLSIVTADPNPSRPSTYLYMWQEEDGAVAIAVPPGLCDVRSARWAAGADSLVISASRSFCLAVPNWASV